MRTWKQIEIKEGGVIVEDTTEPHYLKPMKVHWSEKLIWFCIGFLVLVALYYFYMLYKFGVRVL